MHDAHPASQRLRNIVHQLELLRTGQPEPPWRAIRVHGHLDERQEPWCVLNFIDQHGRCEALHEKGRILPGQLQYEGIIQGYVRAAFRAQCPEQRRFTHLPGARQQNYWKRCGRS